MRYLFIISFLISNIGFGQTDTLNQTDSKGKKQGYWIKYGKDKPGVIYCDSCKIDEGNYIDDKREGVWIKYHPNGNVRLIAEYGNNRPKGEYKKYFQDGTLAEEGNIQGNKNVGAFRKYWENGNLAQEKIFNDEGEVEGVSTYYYENGNIEFKHTIKKGEIVDTTWWFYPNGELKKIEYRDSLDMIQRVPKKPKRLVPKLPQSKPPERPTKYNTTKGWGTFSKEGHNKLYNVDHKLWQDGEFKNGRLWDGKYYKYDQDGNLLKIEIYKDGKYYGDGQL